MSIPEAGARTLSLPAFFPATTAAWLGGAMILHYWREVRARPALSACLGGTSDFGPGDAIMSSTEAS